MAPLLQKADQINAVFSLPTVLDMVKLLELGSDPWAQSTAALLRKRSPLMLEVTLEQIRRARKMGLADELRMERDMVRHCFFSQHLQRGGRDSESVEGIRALVIDKDHQPKWNPIALENVTIYMSHPFFQSPWPRKLHPLAPL